MADVIRAVITGGSGFIGANLLRRLLSDGWKVSLLLRPGHQVWRLPDPEAALSVHLVDIADPAAVTPLLRELQPRHVFHLAAHGGSSWQTDAAEIIRVNLLGTRTLAMAAANAGAQSFVHTGSSSEYGPKDHAPAETELPEPDSDYAIAKTAATLFCQQFARRTTMRLPTLRLYAVYGPWEDPRRLIPSLLVRALAGTWPPLASPETVRDFVWIDDVVDALVLAATRELKEPAPVFNIGTGQQTSLSKIVGMVRDLAGVKEAPIWHSMPDRSWDKSVWQADINKAHAELGWAPQTDLKNGLCRMLDWLRSDAARLRMYSDARSAGEQTANITV